MSTIGSLSGSSANPREFRDVNACVVESRLYPFTYCGIGERIVWLDKAYEKLTVLSSELSLSCGDNMLCGKPHKLSSYLYATSSTGSRLFPFFSGFKFLFDGEHVFIRQCLYDKNI